MKEIYLDNCATTRVDRDVADLMAAMLTEDFGNPSSLHTKGHTAQLRLETARKQVAGALGAAAEEVIFTSGGTEANNLAILGGAGALARRGKTLVAMAYEHSSVLGPLRHLEKQGFTLRLVNPGRDGNVDLDALLAAVDQDTILVSCMLVNSEVGSIAPVAELVRGVRRKSGLALVHCDGVQAFGKIPFSAARLGVDLLSVSAHKIHGPKGCGGLYIRKGARVVPVMYGGGQEKDLRPGTENMSCICGFGLAAEKISDSITENLEKAKRNHEYFVNKTQTVTGLCINSPADSTPYLCNVSLPGYRSEILLHYLAQRGIFVSSGSACSKGGASHVLKAMGLPHQRIDSALRASFCRDTTTADIDTFFQALEQAKQEVARK